MKKKACDVIVGDRIKLDCGYGPRECMYFCSVLKIVIANQLFPCEETKNWLTFYVDNGAERFYTTSYSPCHEFDCHEFHVEKPKIRRLKTNPAGNNLKN